MMAATAVHAQDCSNPVNACPDEPGNLTTEDGMPVPLPSSFCFDSENTVFSSFTTIDPNIEGQSFDDSSVADIVISALNCSGDSTFNNEIGAAVFAAADPCDDTTYESALDCVSAESDSISFSLTDLEPNTTYYIAISGVPGDPPAINPSECGFDVSISGDAVEYDLGIDPDFQQVFVGEEAQISSNTGFDSYAWTAEDLDSGNEPDYTFTADEVVQSLPVQLTVEAGDCEYIGEATVIVRPAVVPPNTFTPNSDGVNDTWIIEGIDNWPNAQVSVYSRWGQRVYQSVNYNNDWDGEGLPAATYYYVIEINPLDFNSDPYTGSVTIIY